MITRISLLPENADVYTEFDFENKYPGILWNFEVHPLQEGTSMSIVINFYIFLQGHEGRRAELHLFGRT